jgi:hypothetical protein
VTYVEKFVKTVSSLYAAIKNDDERSFACICLYIIGWQCAYKLNQTTVVSKWQLPGMFVCSCMLHVLVEYPVFFSLKVYQHTLNETTAIFVSKLRPQHCIDY